MRRSWRSRAHNRGARSGQRSRRTAKEIGKIRKWVRALSRFLRAPPTAGEHYCSNCPGGRASYGAVPAILTSTSHSVRAKCGRTVGAQWRPGKSTTLSARSSSLVKMTLGHRPALPRDLADIGLRTRIFRLGIGPWRRAVMFPENERGRKSRIRFVRAEGHGGTPSRTLELGVRHLPPIGRPQEQPRGTRAGRGSQMLAVGHRA